MTLPLGSLLRPGGAGAQGRQGLLGFLRAFSDQGPEDLACNHWLPFSPRSGSRCTALGLSPPGPRGPLCPLGIQRHKNEGHRNQTLGRAVEHHRKPRQLSVTDSQPNLPTATRHIQGYHYHLSKFHIYALVYCIGVFLSGLLHSV